MKKQTKKQVKTLYVRNIRNDNHQWLHDISVKNGYCPSTALNRILDYVKKETDLEML